MNPIAVLVAAALAGCAAPPGATAQPTDWGIPGKPEEARRTIRITMPDDLRCSPTIIEVGHGETVRLEVRNTGTSARELALGTRQALEERAAHQAASAASAPQRPWVTRVAPGQAGAIVWNFSRVGTFHFACGDAAGVTGQIRVVEPPGHKH